MDLPLAYYVSPRSTTPGRLGVIFDLEANRMADLSGLCSLRLRTPCEWDGVMYQAVGAVEPVPVLSGERCGAGWRFGSLAAGSACSALAPQHSALPFLLSDRH